MSEALGRDGAKRFEFPLLLAGSIAFMTSTMFSAMKPLLITRFVEQTGYSPSLAGLAAAMPFIGGIASSFLMPWLFRHVGARSAMAGFATGLALCEAGNALVFAVPVLVLLGQFLAGICGGVLMGMTSRLIAVSNRAEQTFGVVDMVGVLAMSAMIAGFGVSVEWDGLRGAFCAAAALCALFAAILQACRTALPEPHAAGDHRQTAPLALDWRAAAIVAMGVLFITFSGLGFAFMITAARNLGMSYEEASSAIGIVLFVSAAGCLTGGWCAARFGPRMPLFAAFVVCALGWSIALHATSREVFLLGLTPAIFALQFCFPVLLALAGSLDSEGRLAAIAAPIIVSGFAWAAILAGLLVDRWGLGSLPYATTAGMALCALLLLAGTTQPSRREPGTA
ncbi:MFS transporter [Novosphingobium aquimarinum]|uniref:MFS transporter n=1 Tax=Novosphingobium aquimarinum TaxID=2682494 RepID=UPI0012EB9E29|nr:MFS transporter [Novosphingobium aquimarinum]